MDRKKPRSVFTQKRVLQTVPTTGRLHWSVGRGLWNLLHHHKAAGLELGEQSPVLASHSSLSMCLMFGGLESIQEKPWCILRAPGQRWSPVTSHNSGLLHFSPDLPLFGSDAPRSKVRVCDGPGRRLPVLQRRVQPPSDANAQWFRVPGDDRELASLFPNYLGAPGHTHPPASSWHVLLWCPHFTRQL